MKNYIGRIVSPFNESQSIDFVQLSIFEELIEIEFSSDNDSFSNINYITGEFNNLGNVTLINCQNIKTSRGGGADIKKYKAQYLFKNAFIKNPEMYYFDRVDIEMSGLLDWTERSLINDQLISIKKLTIEQIENIKIYNSDNLSIDIFSSHNINRQRKNNQITIKENVGFRISSKNKDINVWQFLDLIKELKTIFYILSNKHTKIDVTKFYRANEIPVTLYWHGNNSLGTPSPINPIIKFSEIRLDLNDIIENWLEKKDLHTNVELILEKSINNNISHQNYFLNTCFSIETFHRRFKRGNKVFEKSKFKLIKMNILKSIEDEDVRQLVENNLAHMNEPNFKSRLTDFESDFSKLLPKESKVEDFITKIVKTRNYLVHRSSKKNIFENSDLLFASIFIETIIKINVYRTLGLKTNLIERTLNESAFKINRFHKTSKRMRF